MKGEARGSYLPITNVFSCKAKMFVGLGLLPKNGRPHKTFDSILQQSCTLPGLKLQPQHQLQLEELTQYGIDVVFQGPFVALLMTYQVHQNVQIK